MNEQFASLVNERVNPIEFATRVILARKIPQKLAKLVLTEVRKLPEDQHTKYDVLNAFTWVGSRSESLGARHKLQGAAGEQVMEGHCPTCRNQV
jgi:hypothetical protein